MKGQSMFEPVYVSRDSRALFINNMFHDCIDVIPAKIGIVKLAGCVFFMPAIKDDCGKYNAPDLDEHFEQISLSTCQKRYGSVPEPGEAWLVTEGRKFINWEREDQNMFLLNKDGSLYKEDRNDD